MVDKDEQRHLRDKRATVQYSTVREFCEPVARITGRKVRSFLSSTDTEVDGLSMETFLLHAPGHDGPSRIDAEPRTAHSHRCILGSCVGSAYMDGQP